MHPIDWRAILQVRAFEPEDEAGFQPIDALTQELASKFFPILEAEWARVRGEGWINQEQFYKAAVAGVEFAVNHMED